LIFDRQIFLRSFKPDELCVGHGGFREYLAYVFNLEGFVLLESIKKDNAIYVFDKNWESLSKLSKADILNGKQYLCRIVHCKGWKEKVQTLLKNSREEAA
jgi:hypothetical protein